MKKKKLYPRLNDFRYSPKGLNNFKAKKKKKVENYRQNQKGNFNRHLRRYEQSYSDYLKKKKKKVLIRRQIYFYTFGYCDIVL